ncbi:MAG TPA: aldehyde ferredoxin oxidoreductase C-terminal domain-containing protein, partial [Dehalococcoidia bacterium]|nr:aldehyde ferredoxin oxidoreductase C-terminal domain-containing protein [Dehalococcoidia bacterium]
MSYAGRILRVDLTSGVSQAEPLDRQLARDYLGGWGLNARLAYDLIKPGDGALSPDNPLVFGGGLLGGTPCPGAGAKAFVTTRCPSSGVVGTGVSGGWLSSMLKWAGYDHLVVTGRAGRPVYLHVQDGEVSLRDARHLWGLDLVQATDALREECGSRAVIATIGPAGERQAPIAILMENKSGTLGRSAGGVMGSKNLKAIVVEGTRGIKVARKAAFTKLVDRLSKEARADPLRDNWVRDSLYFIVPVWAKAGHLIYRNWSQVYPEERALARFGPQEYQKIKLSTVACASCLTGDKSVVEVQGPEGSHPFWAACPLVATLAYGLRSDLDSVGQAFDCHDKATRYGLDSNTTSALIDWAVDLYEKGILTKEDTGGLELRCGYQTTVKLMDQMARGEGFGAVLAQGWGPAMAQLGPQAAEHAVQIKGSDPDFDARVSLGVETLGSVVNPRGAHDMPVGGISIAVGRKPDFFAKVAGRMGFPPEAMERVPLEPGGANLGRYLAHYEDWCTILNCFGICFRMQVSRLYDIETCAQLYTAATGRDVSGADLTLAARRAYTLYRAANVRQGFTRADDRVPAQWHNQPLRWEDGREMLLSDYYKTRPVDEADISALIDTYYDERGWDILTGVPTSETLERLGLSRVAEDL